MNTFRKIKFCANDTELPASMRTQLCEALTSEHDFVFWREGLRFYIEGQTSKDSSAVFRILYALVNSKQLQDSEFFFMWENFEGCLVQEIGALSSIFKVS